MSNFSKLFKVIITYSLYNYLYDTVAMIDKNENIPIFNNNEKRQS